MTPTTLSICLLTLAATAQAQELQLERVPGEPELEIVAGGEFVSVPIELHGDGVPLPNPPVVRESDHGDVLEAPASGDPYFLGFVAGKHYPPPGERIDPLLLSSLRAKYADDRPLTETYAFAMFSRRITPERLEQLERVGARVLEFHPHYCMKIALPPSSVDSVAALDFIHWLGAAQPWQKLHPWMSSALESLPAGKQLESWINVFDSDLNEQSSWTSAGNVQYGGPDGVFDVDDPGQAPKTWMSNGWQQRALETLGVEVLEYVDSIRAFRVRLAPAQLEPLAELDFVQFIEPRGEARFTHEESMPMILADYTRIAYDGAGVSVGGQADSGLDYSHQGITGFFWWGINLSGSSETPTQDLCSHGTHVNGTFRGRSTVTASYEGAAERLGNAATTRFFNAKIGHGAACSVTFSSLSSLMNSFASSVTDSSGNVTPRPHVVNQSWGTPSPSGGASGTEAACRTIDASVYSSPVLHVFAAGNAGGGARTVNIEPSAKNAFCVGGVRDHYDSTFDPGSMYPSSSRGPTQDNRWKPNIVAPATRIRSAAANTTNGYSNKSGTSMAAPHVSGVAAQLMQQHSFLRHNPTTTGALLMASAMTKDDIVLPTPSSDPAHHLNNYGAGRIEAFKAHYGAGSVYFWGWTQGTSAGNYVDVPVATGATRIAVCLYYHEAAASSGASSALVNNLDLWIDGPSGGINTITNQGDYYTQQSNRDNVELRLLNFPQAGAWRMKVHPTSATSNCRVGLAVLVHYSSTKPDGALSVTSSKTYIQPNEFVDITATAYNPGYIASAVYLDSSSVGDTLASSLGTLEDGAVADFMLNNQAGRDVLVGDIRPNDSRSVKWSTRWATQGAKVFSVNARSDNWVDKTAQTTIYVDGTPPPLPTNLVSTTHTAGQWSNNTTITWTWSQAADNISGLSGYGIMLSPNAPSLPATIQSLGAVTTRTQSIGAGTHYFNLRPVDRSGNWSSTATSAGPYRIDLTNPTAPGSLTSTSHQLGVQSCNPSVIVTWNAATDAGGAGLAGYAGVWNTTAVFDPTGATNIIAGSTSFLQNVGSSTQPRYFHLRARDAAGNWGPTAHFGPVLVNAASVSTYCTGKLNSAGCVPAISSNGAQPSKSAGNFAVTCSLVVSRKSGLLFFGAAPQAAPFQGGTLCVVQPTLRTEVQFSGGNASGDDCTGNFSYAFSTAIMTTLGLNPGQTVYAQYWHRDPQSPSTTGLSNAIQFTVCQ